MNNAKSVIVAALFVALSLRGATAAKSREADPRDYRLDPRHYDIFFSKCERLYLSGGDWKLKQLPNTEKNPADDPGTKAGFMKPDFDDSRWPLQVVPWNWNQPYPETWEGFVQPRGKMRRFAGVGWYRKRFRIPASAKDKRLLLWFGSVDQDCVVYLNGEKVGAQRKYMRYFASSKGYDLESFEFDVTGAARPGEENVLAVRVFDDCAGAVHRKRMYVSKDVGGIWMPVVLRIESPVYARGLRVAPRVADSAVDVSCTLINTTGKTRTLHPVAEVRDYESDRYKVARPGKPAKKTLAPVKVEPGENAFSFRVELTDPVLWSHEEPHLYLLRLSAPEAGGSGLIGLARFGMRQLAVSGKRFLLNGKPVRLRGTDVPSRYHGRRDVCANQSNVNGEFTRFLTKDLNFNWSRCHNWPGRAFFDVCDEAGHMINSTFFAFRPLLYGERWFHAPPELGKPPKAIDRKTLKLEPEFVRRALRPWIAAAFNHPSVVMYNVANEPYDSPDFKKAKVLAAMREAIKKEDPTRLCASFSGRWPGRDEPVPTDFYDIHDYTGSHCAMPYPRLVESLKKYYTGYVKYGKKVLPMVNGECIQPSWVVPFYVDRIMGLDRKSKKKITRTQYVDAIERLLADYKKNRTMPKLEQIISLQNVTMATALDWEAGMAARALGYKRMIEIHRWSDWCEGFNIHCPQLYPPLMGERVAPKLAIRNGCQPIWIGAELFDANVFAGSRLKLVLRVVNDTLSPVGGTSAMLSVKSADGKTEIASARIEIGALAVSERKRIDAGCRLRADAPTGRYRLEMKLADAGDANRVFSQNTYRLFILGKADVKRKIRTAKKVGLALTASDEAKRLIGVMKELGVPYEPISDFSALSRYDVIFIAGLRGPERGGEFARLDAARARIESWLQGGGRLVSIRQKVSAPIPGMPTSRIVVSPHGPRPFADLVVPEHPLFRNVPQPCWDSWNGKYKGIFKRFIKPLSEAVIVRGGVWRDFGMVVAETRVGKGLVLAEQTMALEKYGTDAVAKCFVQNLLAYCLGGEWNGRFAGRMRGELVAREERTFKVRQPKFIDIRRQANRSFSDDVSLDRKGGWTDHGERDLRHFPTGRRTFCGVPFEVIDPKTNSGKSVIVLKGKMRLYFPGKVTIPTGGIYASRLFFLVTAEWCGKGGQADIHIDYAGGTGYAARRTIHLVTGENISDWSAPPKAALPGAAVAWHATHPVTGTDTHVYLIPWKNPEPGVKITRIEVKSVGNGVPVILGITAEAVAPK